MVLLSCSNKIQDSLILQNMKIRTSNGPKSYIRKNVTINSRIRSCDYMVILEKRSWVSSWLCFPFNYPMKYLMYYFIYIFRCNIFALMMDECEVEVFKNDFQEQLFIHLFIYLQLWETSESITQRWQFIHVYIHFYITQCCWEQITSYIDARFASDNYLF